MIKISESGSTSKYLLMPSKSMRAGHRIPILLVLLMIAAPVSGLVVAPNDTSSDGSETLQVDGYVSTKFATVGTEVSVHANVRGKLSSL